MEAAASFHIVLAFLQLGLGVALVAHRWGASRYLAVLFLLNGGASLLAAAVSEGVPGAGRFATLLDAPTGLFIAAFVADRYLERPRVAGALAATGVLSGIAFFAYTDLRQGFPYVVLGSWPLFAAYAAVLLSASATGKRDDALLALAFLPRAVEFGAGVLHGTLTRHDLDTSVNAVAALPMFVAAVVATSWLVHRADPKFRAPALAVFLAGVLVAASRLSVPAEGSVESPIINEFSLGLLRTAFVAAAFFAWVPVAGILASGVVASLATFGTAWAGSWLGLPDTASLWLAIAVGCAALSAVPWWAGEGPKRAVPIASEPQWWRLLAALRGSAAESGSPPRQAWTQKELARATGISVQRVSEFSEVLNRRAGRRLDERVPGWEARFGPGVPNLVVKHRGVVPGMRGVQVYYRLTPAGEALAAAQAQQSPGAPPESGSPFLPSRGPRRRGGTTDAEGGGKAGGQR